MIEVKRLLSVVFGNILCMMRAAIFLIHFAIKRPITNTIAASKIFGSSLINYVTIILVFGQ
jgi:hypothetical protein